MRVILPLAATLILAMAVIACTTVPQSAPTPTPTPMPASNPAPQWVTAPPHSSIENTYFVGEGTGSLGNRAAAEENAARTLASKVTDYIGSAVNDKSAPEMKADLQSIERRLWESISGTSESKVQGFTIADRWIERRGKRITVYLLGKYSTAALDEQRSRLVAIERERTNPVAVAEKHGDELLAKGKPYQAALQYMQAASAATGSNISGGKQKFQENIKKAETALARIRLQILSNNLQGNLDEQLPKPFLLEVTAGANRAEPVADVHFRITYPVPGVNGGVGNRTMSATSDAHGLVTIEIPPPRLFGNQTVSAALDLSKEVEPLLHASGADKESMASFEKAIGSIRTVFHYRTTSRAASIPTGVLVMDLDRGGTPISEDDTAAGIENALTQAGFHILPIRSNRSILGIDTPDLVRILRNNFGGKIERAIVGQARISGFEDTDGTYVVKVTGHVEVAELATGKVLLSAKQIKLSRASDASSAITAAFKDLGTSLGNEIKNGLQ